ncbi:MAG: HPr family phosphocarrier protein [Clostridia bacterium]|nr:HPr family phosphocarrier protein [Clostridia bacterium]
MQSFEIRLKEINDVYTLVNTLVAYDGSVDLGSGRYLVDGRSLLGIFSLDLRQPVAVHVHKDEDVEKLKTMLSAFVVD